MTVLMADAETTLAAELWLSFRSLLRSWAAAASLDSEEAARVAWTESNIILTGAASSLELKFDLASGRGSWHLCAGHAETAHGRFNLLPEGVLERDGKVLDLDHAAIDFVDSVSKRHGFTQTEEDSVLKGHGFSRAEKAPDKEGALAPEGNSPKEGQNQ